MPQIFITALQLLILLKKEWQIYNAGAINILQPWRGKSIGRSNSLIQIGGVEV